MQHLLPPARSIQLRRFVQCRIDARQRGQKDDRTVAELLPDVARNDGEDEPVVFPKEENRLKAQYL